MARPVRLEDLTGSGDGRLRSPSAARNCAEILPVLRAALPQQSGRVLEIASGTGEHAVAFARALPELTWQPTERDPAALRSIGAWVAQAGLPNLRPPLLLDLEAMGWPASPPAQAVVAINLLHIAPWSTTEALLAGAARVLAADGVLFVYGALFRAGHPAAASNLDFDARLRSRDPALGVRSLEDVVAVATGHGLDIRAVVEMPNNNLAVTFARCTPQD